MATQQRWSINVWRGILGTDIIGPLFFDGHLNGDLYLDFLNTGLDQLLGDVPLAILRHMWLQQDRAPAHSTGLVRHWLNNRWIGRGGEVQWPARSPDLTPMDFFLWRYVKNIVYATRPTTTAGDMQNRIRNCFREIPAQMILNVQRSFRERLQYA